MTQEERKARFIAYATRHIDTPTIRKQASKLFNDANKKKGTRTIERGILVSR